MTRIETENGMAGEKYTYQLSLRLAQMNNLPDKASRRLHLDMVHRGLRNPSSSLLHSFLDKPLRHTGLDVLEGEVRASVLVAFECFETSPITKTASPVLVGEAFFQNHVLEIVEQLLLVSWITKRYRG